MKKYLVIGNPISHSLSPKVHNYWLKQNNIDAIYDKIKLEENFYVFTGSPVGVVPILGKGIYQGRIDKLGSVKAVIK